MTHAHAKKPRILVVDDNTNIRNSLDALLLSHGYAVENAEDGLEALKQIIAGAPGLPDLLLLDLDMPHLDGRAVLAALRKARGTRALPILIMTGLRDDKAEVELLRLGADDFVRKSSNFEVILARIEALLRRAHRHP